MECPDCRSALKQERLLELRCVGCGAAFWFRGGEIIREGELYAVHTKRARELREQRMLRAAEVVVPEPAAAAHAAEPPQGMRAGIFCPACRAELVYEQLSELTCSGCGTKYWQRGGEVVPVGESEAVETPGTELPAARARFRKDGD